MVVFRRPGGVSEDGRLPQVIIPPRRTHCCGLSAASGVVGALWLRWSGGAWSVAQRQFFRLEPDCGSCAVRTETPLCGAVAFCRPRDVPSRKSVRFGGAHACTLSRFRDSTCRTSEELIRHYGKSPSQWF